MHVVELTGELALFAAAAIAFIPTRSGPRPRHARPHLTRRTKHSRPRTHHARTA